MFAKPINLALVLIATSFNLLILAIPLIALTAPFIEFGQGFKYIAIDNKIYEQAKISFFLLLFTCSSLMILYLIFDFIIGFSAKSSIAGCKSYQDLKDYQFLGEIFMQVQEKFNCQNVKLLIRPSEEVNAYAIGGLRKNYIVLTQGIINHYLQSTKNINDFFDSIRSILGHEMSHIINKDFLPTYLIITNQKITNLISSLIFITFNIAIFLVNKIPHFGYRSTRTINLTYTLLIYTLTLFNRIVVYNIYEFLRRFVARSTEFRCDKQSALAFGGVNMSLALSMLGKNGYFSLFSTHPSTNKRIAKISQIKAKNKKIKASIIDRFANLLTFILIFYIFIYLVEIAQIDAIAKYYLKQHTDFYMQARDTWFFLKKIINKFL